MPLQIPTRAEVIDGLRNYVRTALPQLDPTTQRRSYVGGMVKGNGSALHDWYRAFKAYADKEPFPQTATDGFLFFGWWADITKLSRLPAAGASGIVVATGQSGTSIPQGSTLEARGTTYEVDAGAIIANQSLNVKLIRDGDTAIAETDLPHQLATGMTVTISGADQPEYNGTFEITATADLEFTYEIEGSPATPATGDVKVSAAYANVKVTARTTGRDTNIDSGGSLEFTDPPNNVDSTALVTFGGLRGGTEIESAEAFR
ncbi:MAG: baseplate J/gp47 family protein, partial [Dichotomicrobium sp.]